MRIPSTARIDVYASQYDRRDVGTCTILARRAHERWHHPGYGFWPRQGQETTQGTRCAQQDLHAFGRQVVVVDRQRREICRIEENVRSRE
jgi:hypothetical protein